MNHIQFPNNKLVAAKKILLSQVQFASSWLRQQAVQLISLYYYKLPTKQKKKDSKSAKKSSNL